MSSHGRAPGPALPLVTHEAPHGRCTRCLTPGPRRWTLQPIHGNKTHQGGCRRHALCRGCLGVLPHRSLV